MANSDSNFRLKYFGLKFLYWQRNLSYFLSLINKLLVFLPNPSPTGTKAKGRGITWQFSPVSVLIRTQLNIYCPVDLYYLLSVSDNSVPIFWLCDYKWGITVFTIFKWIDLSYSNSHFIKSWNISKFLGLGDVHQAQKYSLLDWRVSFHTWKNRRFYLPK